MITTAGKRSVTTGGDGKICSHISERQVCCKITKKTKIKQKTKFRADLD